MQGLAVVECFCLLRSWEAVHCRNKHTMSSLIIVVVFAVFAMDHIEVTSVSFFLGIHTCT